MEKKFKELIQFVTQSYLSLLNSFLFLSRFSVSLKSLNNYFFRWFSYKSLLKIFSVLINYIMWSSNHFSTSSCFLRFLGSAFSGSSFSRVQVFQAPGPGSGCRFRSNPLFSGVSIVGFDYIFVSRDIIVSFWFMEKSWPANIR